MRSDAASRLVSDAGRLGLHEQEIALGELLDLS